MNPITVQTLEEMMQRRRSCRAFLPQQVDQESVRRLFALAQRSASWCNTQPWQVIVTRGAATERFCAAYAEELKVASPVPDFQFPNEYQGVYQKRRRECAQQLYESIGIAPGDRVASQHQTMRNFSLFGAPHVAIITSDRALSTYGAVDCGGYVANLLLAAEAFGLGAIAQAALASHSSFVRRHFAIDDSRLVVCGVSFGYADLDSPANGFYTRRASTEDTVQWLDN
ncbi:nitroreductase [Pseudomonas azerbaijanoccidens]|uniref:nitroreductase n=1 Tax=Pseudomonas azerbaijanoccidentalis TaxID=2842347 RepID=UPI002009EF94|nr:nitroreductase [Pseudomonas azerbaijanoccidentalis]MCK8663950.1 nitroreductase [Pseudomonas azerbaijanoccidentalis]